VTVQFRTVFELPSMSIPIDPIVVAAPIVIVSAVTFDARIINPWPAPPGGFGLGLRASR